LEVEEEAFEIFEKNFEIRPSQTPKAQSQLRFSSPIDH